MNESENVEIEVSKIEFRICNPIRIHPGQWTFGVQLMHIDTDAMKSFVMARRDGNNIEADEPIYIPKNPE